MTFEKRAAYRFTQVAIVFTPWNGLAAHVLLPERKALAGRQPIAVRAAFIDLLRRAGPIDGLRHLFAKDDQVVLGYLRERNGENAGCFHLMLFSGRQALGQLMRRPDASLGGGVQEPRKRRNRFRGRR